MCIKVKLIGGSSSFYFKRLSLADNEHGSDPEMINAVRLDFQFKALGGADYPWATDDCPPQGPCEWDSSFYAAFGEIRFICRTKDMFEDSHSTFIDVGLSNTASWKILIGLD